jgi:putative transposase
MSTADRRGKLDRGDAKLSIRAQCTMLGLSRSGVYRQRAANDDEDLALMRRIDALFLQHPFLGSRRMAVLLSTPQVPVNRKRVQRLMRRMGIAALGPKTTTSKPAPGHKIFPYLLRGLTIDRANQVWAADISVPQQAA